MPLPVPAFSVWADGTLAWNEFLNHVALPPLPDGFPLPPDGVVHVEGSFNGAGEFRFCCALDFESATEPEIAGVRLGRRCRFEFCAIGGLSGGGPVAGEVYLEAEAQLPELPDLPGMVEFSSGDSSGRVRLRFHASAGSGGELQLSAEVMDPLALRLQIPGMPQPEAPIQAELDRAAIEFATASGDVSMKLELLGSFELHPFIPPIQVPVSHYLTPLFATLPELRGSCRLSLGVEGGGPTLGFAATLDNAEVDIDIVGLLGNLAAGLGNPQGSASHVPLEIDFGFRLIGLSFALGGPAPASGSGPLPFAVTLTAQMRLGSVEAVGGIVITDQEFSLGFDRITIPLAIPRFPITREEFERWYNDPAWESTISGHISSLEADTRRRAQRARSRLQVQLLLMQAVCTLRGDYHGADGYHMTGKSRQVYGQWLSCIVDALDKATSVVAGPEDVARYMVGAMTLERLEEELMPEAVPDAVANALSSLKGTVYDSEEAFISALAGHLTPETLAALKASLVKCAGIRGAALRAMIGGKEHRICEDLGITLTDIRFRVPFQSPRDIGVSGNARFSGFVDSYAFLNEVELVAGLSADLIYFTIKTIDGTIPIPDVGRYTGGSITFSEFRFGFGYTKRSVAIAFAGGVVVPAQLVDDLDTADITVAGVRLPVQTRLSFRFELMPVPVLKVIPLFQFNLDLRQNYSPGLADSSRCIPYWDGLQVIVPGVVHAALKQISFSPIFAILPALNWTFDGDFVLGDDHNGFSLIIDDLLGIDYLLTGTAVKIPIPGLAGDSPFCENFCMSVRVAGFAVNFTVQRPFPSASPLALFELLALLSDPQGYRVNPRGELANSLRVTLKDAYVVLPEEVRRHFPGSEALVRRPLDITINLADFIGAAQQIFAIARPIVTAVIDAVQQGADDARNIPARLEQCKHQLATLDWRKLLTWLPAAVRTFSLQASFAGFNADATLVLMTRDEALQELRRRAGKPPARPGFKSLGPGKPFSLNAFRTLMFQLPLPAGIPKPHDSNAPANNAFEAPPFAGLTTRLLKELLPTADEMAVITAARAEVLGSEQQFIGRLSAGGAFRLVTTSDIKPFVLHVAGLAVAMPLKFHGRMELAGDSRGASAQVSVSALWDVVPGLLELNLGLPPALLRIGSDGRFALRGAAQAKLFGGVCSVKGVIDITESHCLIDNATLRHSLDEQVTVEATVRGQIGPQARFALDGDGKLTIFGKAIDITSLKLDDRRLEFGTRLLLSKWKLPDGKSIPCTVDMTLQGGVDFRTDLPNFALAGEGTLEVFGARLTNARGGVHYHHGQLTITAEGVLRWHDSEWLNARVELSPEGMIIQGLVSLPFAITPPGFSMGMVAALTLFARLKLDLASGNLLEMEAHGDWLLGVSLPEAEAGKPHILPIACNRLPELTAPQLPYRLISIDRFPVPKIKGLDLTIPIPAIEPSTRPEDQLKIPIPVVSITLPKLARGTDNAITSILDWALHSTKKDSFLKSVSYEGHGADDEPAINLRDTPLSIPTRFNLGWSGDIPQLPLPFDHIPGFSLWLAWNPKKKRFEIASEAPFPPPRIDVLYNPVGIDSAGEYVELHNTADIAIDLTGWLLHDAADYTHTYTFPPFTLPPGKKVKLWTKEGSNDEGNLYWGLKHAVWNNLGDTVVLKDANGEIARFSYRKRLRHHLGVRSSRNGGA